MLFFVLTACGNKTQIVSKNLKVSDIITFGHFEQDNDLSNGAEPIEWQVIAVEKGRALVISRKGLDLKPYNAENDLVSWENCTLRKWLNDEFLNSSFNDEEQKQILEIINDNPDNKHYPTGFTNSTSDRIFLLSTDEYDSYLKTETDKLCESTAFAAAKREKNGITGWWLRTPAKELNFGAPGAAAFIEMFDSSIDYFGGLINDSDFVVRPALWVKQ